VFGRNKLVTVEVFKKDLMEGIPEDPCCCPVTLAIGRHVPPLWSVTTDRQNIHLLLRGRSLGEIQTPPEVKIFISTFDQWRTERVVLEPFSFSIRLPRNIAKVWN
jgi:hypothetical protein